VTLKTGLGSMKVIEKNHHSIQSLWLPVDVL